MTERERVGHADKFHDVRNAKGNDVFNEDAVGGKESMMRRRRETFQRRKSFNENLQPLKKFLHSALGRKWDDVYSEICSTFDKRKVINDHILQHLFDYVEINAAIVDGKACVLQRWSSSYAYVNGKYTNVLDYESRWQPVEECETGKYDYYVCPFDGLLKKVDRHGKGKRSAAKRKAETLKGQEFNSFRNINGYQELHRVDGVWKIFTAMQRPPVTYSYEMPYDWKTPAQRMTWNAMNGTQRAKVGRKVANHVRVTEFKTPGHFGIDLASTWYWGSCEIAGKKILKKFGLVGTNAYKPPEPMSHREAAKYRTNNKGTDRSLFAASAWRYFLKPISNFLCNLTMSRSYILIESFSVSVSNVFISTLVGSRFRKMFMKPIKSP